MKKIEKIVIKREIDEDCDVSYYGSFDTKPWSELAIEHELNNSITFNYFNPENCENEKQARENYERVISLDNGVWGMIGIRAEAMIMISLDGGEIWKFDTISSGGLWGIEDDDKEERLIEIETEELNEVKKYLMELGFTKKEVEEAEVVEDY